MGRKKPWCFRTETRQSTETVEDKHVWKHAPRMFYGWLLEVGGICSAFASILVVNLLHVRDWIENGDDPYRPSYWEVAAPMIAKWVSIGLGLFILGLVISLPGKRRMKRLLLPVRCQRCPRCFYDLSSRLRHDDICPECGVVAPRRECVRLWCRLLRSRF